MTHPWDFGWEAIVAIATGGLALFTAYLALSTRKLAREAGNETRANWRPVLAIELQPTSAGVISRRRSVYVDEDEHTLTVNIRNVGRGPALHVTGSLDVSTEEKRRLILGKPVGSVVAPGDYLKLTWTEFDAPRHKRGELPTWLHLTGWAEYVDVSGAIYVSTFVIGFQGKRVEIVTQYVEPKETPDLVSGWVMRLPQPLLKRIVNRVLDRRVEEANKERTKRDA
jgi:hypothetical protein